jgi:hypothetical protein
MSGKLATILASCVQIYIYMLAVGELPLPLLQHSWQQQNTLCAL